MPKFILGSIFGAIFTGLGLIFLGRQLYPVMSTSYSIIWMLLAGTISGVSVGIAGHYIQDLLPLAGSAVLMGALIFGIFSVILATNIIYSALLGTVVGLLTGGIIHLFGSNSWVSIEEQD
ncbi:MAG: hypothetical protein MAGBODY4_00231 [Candidatus Marinimicrobia bacterium]|nr:hypothetical protein [Candidatus Neomarinimicrobiota bacterium]